MSENAFTFGQKASEADDTAYTGNYLRNWKKGANKVRFLEEADDWTEFREHYTLEGKSFPCTRDKSSCPGCTHENERVQKASRKFGTNVFLPGSNVVLPFRMPVKVKESMDTRTQTNGGTILNRDYIIYRQGEGMDTSYDVDTDDKYEVDVPELLKQALNIEGILQEAFEQNSPGGAVGEASQAPKATNDDPPSEPVSAGA